MCTCRSINISDEKTVHLFYYVAVPLADDALEEDPNLYKGLILNSFSNGFEFVDLGNFKPAAGPPMQKLAMYSLPLYIRILFIYKNIAPPLLTKNKRADVKKYSCTQGNIFVRILFRPETWGAEPKKTDSYKQGNAVM